MRTWHYFTASGSVATVTAARVLFAPGHVVFQDDHKGVVLAEDNANVRCLAEDDVEGSSDRRPAASST